MTDLLTEVDYKEQLHVDLINTANQLVPYFDQLQSVTNYTQLLSLDSPILALLIKHERTRVDLSELINPAIDFRSSGHHRDKLEIYSDALNREPVTKGVYVYMDDDGAFQFNLLDNVKATL
jgi:hypothetical protein